MIEVLKITDNTVGWKDEEGDLHVYPRSMFPKILNIGDKFEYLAGKFQPYSRI